MSTPLSYKERLAIVVKEQKAAAKAKTAELSAKIAALEFAQSAKLRESVLGPVVMAIIEDAERTSSDIAFAKQLIAVLEGKTARVSTPHVGPISRGRVTVNQNGEFFGSFGNQVSAVNAVRAEITQLTGKMHKPMQSVNLYGQFAPTVVKYGFSFVQ